MWRRRSRSESDEVRRAREEAKRAAAQRQKVEAQLPAAQEIGASLRTALERNHFGESIERALLRRGSA